MNSDNLRVVLPVFLGDNEVWNKAGYSMVSQLMTAISSYFINGNTVPIIVATDSQEVMGYVNHVASKKEWPISVSICYPSDIEESTREYVNGFINSHAVDCNLCRPNVVAAKMYTMLSVGTEYDRLIVDIDTLFFKQVPWEQFDGLGFAMFQPKEWYHPYSITTRQAMYYRAKDMMHMTITEYIDFIQRKFPIWKHRVKFSQPWPNSGVMFITSDYTNTKYRDVLKYDVMYNIASEDESPLFLLQNSKDVEDSTRIISDLGINVPVGFTDITKAKDLLHPDDIIVAHYHRTPKPCEFNLTYHGVIQAPNLHQPYYFGYLADGIACGQYGSLSGILWCYVWRYYYSITAQLWDNGDIHPIYEPSFWKNILYTYYSSRNDWNESLAKTESIVELDKNI